MEPKQAGFRPQVERDGLKLAAAAEGEEGQNKALCTSECYVHVCGKVL